MGEREFNQGHVAAYVHGQTEADNPYRKGIDPSPEIVALADDWDRGCAEGAKHLADDKFDKAVDFARGLR